MKTVVSIASLLACAFSLDAQIATTLNHLPDGSDEIRIRNNSATSLVAFVVAGKRVARNDSQVEVLRNTDLVAPRSARDALAGENISTKEHSSSLGRSWSHLTAEAAAITAPFVVYSDPLIEPASRPLPANEERVTLAMHMQMRIGGRLGVWSLEEPVVAAGIFSDGATTGDPALLSLLMLRRSNMLLAVETALEALSNAGRQGIPRYQLIVQFKKMTDSLHRWYLPAEQQIGLRVYQPILGKLMNMPGGNDRSPDPLATLLEEETAMLRQQRVTLSESQPSLADVALIGR
jgi:hypothetical protein